MLHSLHTRHSHQHTGTVDGILQALVVGQGLTEGRMLRRKKLTCEEGLHNGDADTFFGTPLE